MRGLILGFLALTTISNLNAQEIDHEKVMVERIDELRSEIKKAKSFFEEEDLAQGCSSISIIVDKYKEHLVDSGHRLELTKRKSSKVVKLSYNQLIYFHKLKTICETGENQEYVKAEEEAQEMKKILKSLKKQRKRIKRDGADEQNDFEYNYSLKLKLQKNK